MKENKKYIGIIILCSLFIMIPFMNGIYFKGHDTFFHVSNISAIIKNLHWSDLLVQEPLPYIAHNFGYGTRFFYPPLPHLCGAYLSKITNVIVGMRITDWLMIVISGISCYYLCLKLFQKKNTSLVLSLFYMTAPYHLSEIFIRDAFSEMFIPAFLPMVILGLLELKDNHYLSFLGWFTGGYILLVYSHLAMSIYLTLILLVTYFPIYIKKIWNKKSIGYLCISAFFILFSTCAFWGPLLEMKLHGSYAVFMPYFMTGQGDLKNSTLKILEYFRFNDGHAYGWIRFRLQFIVLIFFFLGLYIFCKEKKYKNKEWLFILLFFCVSLWMTTKFFPWEYCPNILQTLQFPWRLVIYVTMGAILLSGLAVNKISNKWLILLLILFALGSCYYNIYPASSLTVEANHIDYNLGLGNQSEYLPVNTIHNMDYYQNRDQNIHMIQGFGQLIIKENNIPTLNFNVTNSKDLVIELPRLYYLGYVLKRENQVIPIYENENGFIEISHIESGEYTLTYEGTNVMHVTTYLSLFTLLSFITILVLLKNHLKDRFYK